MKRSRILGFLFGLSLIGGLVFAGATFSRIKTWSSGETLTASDLNAEFNNVLNNLTPAGIDDYSATTTEMRALTDPYPGTVESQATSLQGELERLRYQILQIKNTLQPTNITYWYQDLPTAGVFTILGSSVGVNDTTPDYTMDVAGTLGVDGITTFGGAVTTTGTAVAISTNVTVAGTLAVTGAFTFNNTLIAAQPSTKTGVASGSNSDVSWGTEVVDRLSELSATSFTAVSTGYYHFSGLIAPTPDSTGGTGITSASILLRKNGATDTAHSITYSEPGAQGEDVAMLPFDWILSLTAGDVILFRVTCTTKAGGTWGYGSASTWLNVVREP